MNYKEALKKYLSLKKVRERQKFLLALPVHLRVMLQFRKEQDYDRDEEE